MNEVLEREQVAIVGIGCRGPDAYGPDEFWRNLIEGRESITRAYSNATGGKGIPVSAEGIVDDADKFDASFFGISIKEAQMTDPQQLMLLECVWNALEDYGNFEGAGIGLFASAGTNVISAAFLLKSLIGRPEEHYLLKTSNDKDYVATKIAYRLGLKGPAVTVQSACSSSLVALHLAKESLLASNCEVAVVGGVSVRTPQRGYQAFDGGPFSPTGICRPFDAAADGIVPGNGGGAIVMKRLSSAIRDRDNIYCLVSGSAINNDGQSKIGFAAPSPLGQESVIVAAIKDARIASDQIGYVECHGTGTPLGDPIELSALHDALETGNGHQLCGIGSVKSNIGHLGPAAGIFGVIKTALSVKHRMLVPSLNFVEPNSLIETYASRFYVVRQASEWKSEGQLHACVSSFGMGGTNAHVVISEYARPEHREPDGRYWFLPLSAHSFVSLRQKVRSLLAAVEDDWKLQDLAFTLCRNRRAMAHRIGFIVKTISQLREQLRIAEGSNYVSDTMFSHSPVEPNRTPAEMCLEVYKSPLARGAVAHFGGHVAQEDEAIRRLISSGVVNSRQAVQIAEYYGSLLTDLVRVQRFESKQGGVGSVGIDLDELFFLGNTVDNSAVTEEVDTLMDGDVHRRVSEFGLLREVASLWVAGSEIAFDNFDFRDGSAISLPPYPFCREKITPSHDEVLRDLQRIIASHLTASISDESEPNRELTSDVISSVWLEWLAPSGLPGKADFYELGGDSLAALSISTGISEALNIDVSASEVLSTPLLEEFVKLCQSKI